MKLRSNNFNNGDYLADAHLLSADFGFGTDGGNSSPHLAWDDVPANTESFAITCYDPDAPTGSGFWHWLVVNIPSNVRQLPEGAGSVRNTEIPSSGLQTRTDFGSPGYGGPAPPDGPHRYFFTVFALSINKVLVSSDTSPALVGFHLNANCLAKASLIALARPAK